MYNSPTHSGTAAPARRSLWPRRPARVLASVAWGLAVAALAPAVQAGDGSTVAVHDAAVVANTPGTFPLTFPVTRAGDLDSGIRLLVQTAVGGPQPGIPGVDYVPLPAGTEILVPPGAAGAEVVVEALGDPVPGPADTLLLQITAAGAYHPDPRLEPGGLHYSVCCFSTDMAVGDLDGDGHTDVVTGNGMSFDFAVLLADGAGGFQPAVSYPIAGVPVLGRMVVEVADVNGDGHLDVLTAGYNSQHLEISTGDGEGGFAAPSLVPLVSSEFPPAFALGDLDGDGDLDLVVTHGLEGNVAVMLGDGDGGFASAVVHPAGSGAFEIALADINGDGHLDAITTNLVDLNLSLLAGDGSGGFAAPQILSIGPDVAPLAVSVADVTADGVLDIVTGNQSGAGEFPPPEAAGSLSVLAGDGGGGFEPATVHLLQEGDGRVQGLALGDVTGDGLPDLVGSLPIPGAVAVLAGDGSGDFAPALYAPTGAGPYPVVIFDATGDGLVDVLTANVVGANLTVLPTDGVGGVGLPGRYPVGVYPHAVASADLDGDGFPDVVTANAQSHDVSVLLNDGSGSYLPAVSHAVGASPLGIAVGDVDGDGAIDIVTADAGDGAVSLLRGDGLGGFVPAVSYSVGAGFVSPYAVALGDVDGDGFLDVATANTNISGDGISVLLGDGSGGFGEPVAYDVGPDPFNDPHSISLVDADGDGFLDILTANTGASNLSLLAGDGSGVFGTAQQFVAGLGPVMAWAVDVDGDGHRDLVSLNHTAQTVSVLAGDGAGGFGVAVHYDIYVPPDVPCEVDPGPCPWAWGFDLADLTGDGWPDIVTANTQINSVSVLANDGSGAFPAFEVFGTGSHPGSLTVADVDGDGNLDVVTANRENHDIAVLHNRLGAVAVVAGEALGTIHRQPAGGPQLAFDPPELDFGEVPVGSSGGPLAASLHNLGDADATGLAFELTGKPAFELAAGTCGSVLPPGESCSLSVLFSPTQLGSDVAILSASSDQGAGALLTLLGTAIEGADFLPEALHVDALPALSDGNQVLEPGEGVEIAPAWRNASGSARSLSGHIETFEGPAGATYTIDLDAADYGLLAPGSTGDCRDTGVCYALSVDDPSPRPAAHWDASFEEVLSDGDGGHDWALHIGDSFGDVPRSSSFYSAVETLLHHQVTGGCGAGNYCPQQLNSRAQLPVFVLRALEGPGYDPPACVAGEELFGDVPAASPSCPWIEELARRQVVAGCGNGNYCPGQPARRDTLAVYLLRSLEGPAYQPAPCSGLFTDVPCPSTFADWVEELARRGITAGCGPETYCPADPVRRGQIAAFVTAGFGLQLYGP